MHRAVDERIGRGPDVERLYEEALAQHRRAARLDPDWAEPHLGACRALHWLASGLRDAPRSHDLYGRAKGACLKALERDPALAEAHAALGFVLLWGDWDWEGADRAFARAAELGHEDAWGHTLYLGAAGRLEEAIGYYRRAREKLAGVALLDVQLTETLLCAGRAEEAAAVARRLLERPDHDYVVFGHAYLAQSLLLRGRPDEALAEARKALDVHPDDSWALASLGYLLAQSGDLRAARKWTLEREGIVYVT